MAGLRDVLIFINGHQAVVTIFLNGLLALVVFVMSYFLIYRAVPAWIERTSPVFNVRVLTVASEDLAEGVRSVANGLDGTTGGLDYQFFRSLPHGFIQNDWNMAHKEIRFSIPPPPRVEGGKASEYHFVYVWILNDEPMFPPSQLEVAAYEFDFEVQVGGTVEYISDQRRGGTIVLDGGEAFVAIPRSALVSSRRNHTDKVILRQQRVGHENVDFGTKENSR